MSKAGIDRALYLEILTNTLFAAPVYKTYGGIIAEEGYTPPGFKARLGFKDIHDWSRCGRAIVAFRCEVTGIIEAWIPRLGIV